jgi:hypothetical protein
MKRRRRRRGRRRQRVARKTVVTKHSSFQTFAQGP